MIWNNENEIPDDGIDNDGNGYVDDTQGWDFCDGNGIVYDSACPLQSAHATHIAGIIASVTSNYITEESIMLMPLRVFDDYGAYTSDIIEAIEYAEANGTKIVNCSFGSSSYNREDTVIMKSL